MEYSPSEMSNKGLRPRFLTILCYLTIFASTYMVFSSIGGIANPEAVARQMNDALGTYEEIFQNSQPQNPDVEKAMESLISDVASALSTSSVKENNIFTLIINILSLIGAWLMLKLRKIGFHFYIVSNLIAVAAPLLVFGSNNILGFSLATYYGITGILFVILYALKMKYMH